MRLSSFTRGQPLDPWQDFAATLSLRASIWSRLSWVHASFGITATTLIIMTLPRLGRGRDSGAEHSRRARQIFPPRAAAYFRQSVVGPDLRSEHELGQPGPPAARRRRD